MTYYYFNPFNKQYLFPKGYEKHAVFKSFYQAYTFKGRIIWWLWRNVFLIRKWCQVDEPEKFVPLAELKPYFKNDTLFAFNRGTLGIEQKTSILAIDKDENEFFIKYATTDRSRENVNNEGEILAQLKSLEFVPRLIQHVNEETFTFIQTTVLHGERVVNQNIQTQILSLLKKIATLDVKVKNQIDSELITCFSHGDFCPWNMMLKDHKLLLFDWEMANQYPLGYDLFTYIFQTSFLLSPSKKMEVIINENQKMIEAYFLDQNMEDWHLYLLAFSKIKVKLEQEKNNHTLLSFYQNLKNYLQNG